MNRMLASGILTGGIVFASATADARTVPAYASGHPLNPNQWPCFAEVYGGVQTAPGAQNNPICNPNTDNSATVGWEIGLPVDTANTNGNANIGCDDPDGIGNTCQLLASDNTFFFVAWSNVVTCQSTDNLTTTGQMTLNNSGVPAGGSLYMVCSVPVLGTASLTVVSYDP